MLHVHSLAARVLNRLWQPNDTKELWVRIPLGFVNRRVYNLERLGYTVGWHYRYLLLTADWRMSRPGWRVQSQVQCRPLTTYEPEY